MSNHGIMVEDAVIGGRLPVTSAGDVRATVFYQFVGLIYYFFIMVLCGAMEYEIF